jgi:uncharacterized delta-60 repeat protein
MADRIITFQYAKDNYDAYKKQTIPASNECMTKADVNTYLNADMSILSSYNNNQLVPRVKFSPILTGGFNSEISGMILQSDGKIVVVGYFSQFNTVATNHIIRLNSDGTRDTSFNIGSGFNNYPYGIVQQTDGKFVIIGAFTSYNGVSANRIIRLNLDGSVDTSFSVGSGFNDMATKIAIQSDNKVIITGNFTSYNGSSINRIIRLNSNGTRDTSFNPGSGFMYNYSINGLGVLSNGQIIVAGSFDRYNGVLCPMMIKLNSNGTRDTSFQYPYNGTTSKYISGIHITLDLINGADKITISVYDSLANYATLERYLYNGSFDTAILSGSSTNSVNGRISAIYLVESSPVDLYLLSGLFTELRTSSGNIPANRIVRIDSNGNKDNAFNYGTGFSGGFIGARVIIFQTNGKYLLGGDFTSYNGTTADRIVRLNQDGTRG